MACKDRIEELQAQGYDILAIHSKLVEEKHVTMSYAGFYENFTQRRKKEGSKSDIGRIKQKTAPIPNHLAGPSRNAPKEIRLNALEEAIEKRKAAQPQATKSKDVEYSIEDIISR